MTANKFWETKPLQDYTAEEWESICSRCGQCCLIKLQDEDGGEVYYTNVVCRYFNSDSHCCSEYNKRCTLVSGLHRKIWIKLTGFRTTVHTISSAAPENSPTGIR